MAHVVHDPAAKNVETSWVLNPGCGHWPCWKHCSASLQARLGPTRWTQPSGPAGKSNVPFLYCVIYTSFMADYVLYVDIWSSHDGTWCFVLIHIHRDVSVCGLAEVFSSTHTLTQCFKHVCHPQVFDKPLSNVRGQWKINSYAWCISLATAWLH